MRFRGCFLKDLFDGKRTAHLRIGPLPGEEDGKLLADRLFNWTSPKFFSRRSTNIRAKLGYVSTVLKGDGHRRGFFSEERRSRGEIPQKRQKSKAKHSGVSDGLSGQNYF